jgi:hypothetical protein
LESFPSYFRKILTGNFHEEEDRHTLKDQRKKLTRQGRAYNAQKIEEEESEEEETLKTLVILKNHQRFMKERCRRRELLKNSKNHSNSLKIPTEGRII